jgi:hypothetical protein
MIKATQAARKAAADLYVAQLGDEDGFAEKIRAGTNHKTCTGWEDAFEAYGQAAAQAERDRILAILDAAAEGSGFMEALVSKAKGILFQTLYDELVAKQPANEDFQNAQQD